MSPTWETEICVIGGGPAGSTVATRLARLGHQVLLAEKHNFPRPHVGESLTPGILPLLDALAIRERIEKAPFLRPNRALISWRGRTSYVDFHSPQPGFQVDRAQFDALLLQLTAEAGVKILQPAVAMSPIRESALRWIVPLRYQGQEFTVGARFLVDASGRSFRLPGQRQPSSPATLALYGYWYGTGLSSPETRVEAGKDCWFWGAPLPDHGFNAAVFLDAKRFDQGPTDRDSFYRAMLAESALLRSCLQGTLRGGVMACDASTYHVASPAHESFMKVGEAAFAIDPLSSQGVQAAMLSALQASIVCHTILTSPANIPAALQFYTQRQAGKVRQHSEWASNYYAGQQALTPHPFWQKRSTAAVAFSAPPQTVPAFPDSATRRIEVASGVCCIETPVIERDLIALKPAITHPRLPAPVAFLHDVPLAPLLQSVEPGQTCAATLEKWSRTIPRDTASQVFRWLWQKGLIVPAEINPKSFNRLP